MATLSCSRRSVGNGEGHGTPTLLANIAQTSKMGWRLPGLHQPPYAYPLPTPEAVEATKIAATQSLTRCPVVCWGTLCAQGSSLAPPPDAPQETTVLFIGLRDRYSSTP